MPTEVVQAQEVGRILARATPENYKCRYKHKSLFLAGQTKINDATGITTLDLPARIIIVCNAARENVGNLFIPCCG
jgi:hypothetical protein